jgi:hypothetical protein
MQMHPDLGRAPPQHGLVKPLKVRTHHHFIIRQVRRDEPIILAAALKTRKPLRVVGGNLMRVRPEVVPLRIDGDEKGRLHAVSIGGTLRNYKKSY